MSEIKKGDKIRVVGDPDIDSNEIFTVDNVYNDLCVLEELQGTGLAFYEYTALIEDVRKVEEDV